VTRSAQLVTVDEASLASYGAELARHLARRDRDDIGPLAPQDPELAAGTVLALDAINFGSGYHDAVAKLPGHSGARTMAAHLRREIDRNGAVSCQWLSSLGPPDCARIFGQRLDQPDQRELMTLFAEALRQLGRFVGGRFAGSFLALVEAAGGSAQRLADSLLAMPSYLDQHELEGELVHFYKRAQISAADLARAFAKRPPADFGDLDQLTCFADNLVPHVLRVDGVLAYDDDLAGAIDAGQRLEPGSRAEVEIRAAGVEAVERLTAGLRDRHQLAVTAMDVDLLLWTRGGGARYKAIPRHRSRCCFY
jgi:hypothetical protein